MALPHITTFAVVKGECVFVTLVIQHAERMHRIISSFVAYLTLPYFLHYLLNDIVFGETILNIKCVLLILSTTFSETFLVPKRIE